MWVPEWLLWTLAGILVYWLLFWPLFKDTDTSAQDEADRKEVEAMLEALDSDPNYDPRY